MKYWVETDFGKMEYYIPYFPPQTLEAFKLRNMTNNIPQLVTNRYISNLTNKGRNDTFEIITLERIQATHDGIVVGSYYDVVIIKPMPDHTSERASGVTPAQAVSRALAKFGVTYRDE